MYSKTLDFYEEIKGDLFTTALTTSSLCHCVSADMKMGKGIAKIFRERYGCVPELLSQHKQIGQVAVLKINSNFIYYLVTKEKYWQKPTYDTIYSSLEAMKLHALTNNVTHISSPLIGAGLDKLNWPRVREIIHNVFKGTNIKFTVLYL